jgi:formylglycine-generating enzyme required for sulfatase activity
MSGNVWEWTRSNYDNGKDDLQSNDTRVLRGGAFFSQSDIARCSYRGGDDPDRWNWNGGFRVVVSPILPSRL